MADKVIGKISATEKAPSTVDKFYFWTDKHQILNPFDVVKVKHEGDSITYGVVEEINHITDAPSHLTSFISSDFGDTDEACGNMDRLGMNYVRCQVSSNTKGIYTPVLNGSAVSLCDVDDIKNALGLREQDIKNPLVCGYLDMYSGDDTQRVKVSLNSHFVFGPDGAHLNVSGISGLAAKTSFSMFLLQSMQQKTAKEKNENDTCAYILFNVKGRDLMAIDEPNEGLEAIDKKIYDELGLRSEPFSNVKFFYPYKKGDGIQSYVNTEDFKKQQRKGAAYVYKFTYENNKDNLDLLLADEDDSTHTMESCVNAIINEEDPFKDIKEWKTLEENIRNRTLAGSKGSKEISTSSWRKFMRCIRKAITNDIFNDTLKNGQVDIGEHIRDSLKAGDVIVVDIAHLDSGAQNFVFGSVAKAVYDVKLSGEREDIPKKIVLFVDELNKYASNDVPKDSPILKQLLDIAERGRSLGIVLFSVEQFRSAIHDRVKGNCSTNAYGRTNGIEVSKADYRYIPETYRNMITRLAPGEYIISNPALRSLIKIKFPRPTYKQFPNG